MSILRKIRKPLKRGVDIVGASVGLVCLSPVYAAVGLAIRKKLGSPVLFKHDRPGKDGEIFTLLKFRTMLEPDPARGLVIDDQRMTPFGRRLRATSLDELPTLVNVLKGDMSLVGPRPLLTRYLDQYTERQARRHEVRPGITGLAQVSGRNALSWEERFELDVEYVENHNLLLDLKIIAQTLAKVFTKSDIEAEGTSTMTIFAGAEPDDGLTEVIMTSKWHQLWSLWQTGHRSQTPAPQDAPRSADTRYWVYLDDTETPVGIAGLSGLGTPDLTASIVLNPAHDTERVGTDLLIRVMQHAIAFQATRVHLQLPEKYRSLQGHAQDNGFLVETTDEDDTVTLRESTNQGSGAPVSEMSF